MVRAYCDHAAHSPLRPAALDAWLAASELVGNPAGLHTSSRRARAALEDARESIAADLGAHPAEVVLTSGGSEADTIAVLGSARARADRRVLIGAVEHPAVLRAVDVLGSAVGLLDVDRDARVLVPEGFDADVALVSVQTVNNEFGTTQPVVELAELAHRAGAWFHTDAVQAVLWPGVDFADSGADLLSVSAHKIGGPVGIGALLARREVEPAAVGLGGRQERDLRSGTQMVALTASFAAALHEAVSTRQAEVARLTALTERLRGVLAALPGTRLNGGEAASPLIVSATFDGLLADDLLLLLDRAGVDASVGSACRAGVHQPSEVVLAAGGSEAEALGTVRFSFGWSTTTDDLERLCEALPQAVGALAK